MTNIGINGVNGLAKYGLTFEDEDVENIVEKDAGDESVFAASASNTIKVQEHSGFHLFDKVEYDSKIGDAIRCKGVLSQAGDFIGGIFEGIGNFFGNIFNGIGNFFGGFFGKKEEVNNSAEIEENKDNETEDTRFEGISDEIIEKWSAFADPCGDIYYDKDGELIVETRVGSNDDEMKDFYALHVGEVRYDYTNEDGYRMLGIAVNVKNETPSESNLETRDGVIGDTKQGQKGDCWLLSGVNALSYTEEGRKIIKDALEYHDGYTIVHLKGAKDYEITDKEIEEARLDSYSTGDDDMLIFELAVQKAFEDVSNKNIVLDDYSTNKNISGFDGVIAEGSYPVNLLYLITGKDSHANYDIYANLMGQNWEDISEEELNDFMASGGKELATVLSADNEMVIKDVNGNDVKISAPHAYALKEVTDDTVTFTNPHDSSVDITISRDIAATVFSGYSTCDLSENNPVNPANTPDIVCDDGTKIYIKEHSSGSSNNVYVDFYTKNGEAADQFSFACHGTTPFQITRLNTKEQKYEYCNPPEDSTLSAREFVNKIVERGLANRNDLSIEDVVEYASLGDKEWQEAKKDLN